MGVGDEEECEMKVGLTLSNCSGEHASRYFSCVYKGNAYDYQDFFLICLWFCPITFFF